MRRFTRRLFVAMLAVAFGYAVACVLAPLRKQSATWQGKGAAGAASTSAGGAAITPGGAKAGVGNTGGDGNDVVARVLDTLEHRPIVVAKARQSLHFGDQILSGSGEYCQQGVGNLRRTSWQLQTVVAGQPASFGQVFTEGRYLWTDRRVGEQRTVTRVDVTRLLRELGAASEEEGQGRGAAETMPIKLLARGGLSQLVAELVRQFDFGSPQPARCGDKAALALIGRWRPEQLAREWAGISPDRGEGWPRYLPHHVLLEVGEDDLFPYLVEYRGGDQAPLATTDEGRLPTSDPLVRYEFFDVDYMAAMPNAERLFAFQSTEIEWQDVTARFVDRLRQR